MQILILFFSIPAIWWIATRSVEDALIDIGLPVMVLIPMFYQLEPPHLAPFNAHDVVLLPIAIVALVKFGKEWRPQRSDLWMAIFVFGFAYAEGRTGISRGIRGWFEAFFYAFLPYLIGKLLIEREGIRERFVRRFLWLIALVAVLSIPEFLKSENLFVDFFGAIFNFKYLIYEQPRNGFTRVQGPFEHAIVAGIVFGSAWILALWLHYIDRRRLGKSERRFLGIHRSTLLLGLVTMGLLFSYSRGPWMGALLGFAFFLVARAKNVVRTALIVTPIVLVLGGITYEYIDAYTSATFAKDLDQQDAIYRRQLLEAYAPIADGGGIFGWGVDFPRLPYLNSIDNEYLLVRLVQGVAGLTVFLLLASEAIVALIRSALRFQHEPDFSFSITLLGVVCGMMLTLASVGLGAQSQELFFLFMGWSISIRQTRTAAAPESPEARDAFPRVFA